MSRHSKVQQEVLRLYKAFLRVAQEKPGATDVVRQEFRRNALIPRSHILHIEYLLRRGKSQLQTFQSSSVSGVTSFTIKSSHSEPNVLQSMLKHFPQEGRIAAFGYGSAVFRQIGNISKQNMIDMFLIVSNAHQWHAENLKQNSHHYSFVKFFGAKTIARIQESQYGAQIYFNTEVPCEGRMIKYGVITRSALLDDLMNWKYLYAAGRLQKPVKWIERGDEEIQNAYKLHLRQSMALSLLLLPCTFSETELFEKVTSLSYSDDLLRKFAENANKVGNIVSGQMSDFRSLYGPILHDMSQVDWRNAFSDLLMRQTSTDANSQLLSMLPYSFLTKVALNAGLPVHEFSEERVDSLCHSLAEIEHLHKYLNQAIGSIVSRSSFQQSLKSAITAGLFKSFNYSLKKLKKK